MLQFRLTPGTSAQKLDLAVGKLMKQLEKNVIATARSKTPVDTGYAQSQWNSRKTTTGFDVTNPVDYTEWLEKGHSRQAPKGILGPTVRSVKRSFNSQNYRLKSGRLSR